MSRLLSAASVARQREYQIAYRADNYEKLHVRSRAWYAANSEKMRSYQRAYRAANREKVRAGDRARYAANPEKYRERVRAAEKRHGFRRTRDAGFTPEMFTTTIVAQGNACAICRRAFSENLKPFADHCHDTKRPRGVLCRHCNTADGHIKRTGLTPSQFGAALSTYLLRNTL